MKKSQRFSTLIIAFVMTMGMSHAVLPDHLKEEALAGPRAQYDVSGTVHGYPVKPLLLKLQLAKLFNPQPKTLAPYRPFNWDDAEAVGPTLWQGEGVGPVLYWKDGAFYIHFGRVELNGRTFEGLPHDGWKALLAEKLQEALEAVAGPVIIDGEAVPILKKEMDAREMAFYGEIFQPIVVRVAEEYEQARTVLASLARTFGYVQKEDGADSEDYPAVFSVDVPAEVAAGEGSGVAPGSV